MEDTPIISSAADPKNLRIQQQFCLLQHHWNHYKTSNYHRSSNQYSGAVDVEAMIDYNNNSPREDLNSSLHRHGTGPFSSSSTWKIRTNELAQEEIRRERRAAIASGKLKGRKLSYDDIDIDMGLGVKHGDVFPGNYWNGFVHNAVPSIPFPSSDSDEEFAENSNGEVGKEEEVPVCLNGLSYSSASSSSSSSLLGKEMKEQMAAKEEENVTPSTQVGNGRKKGKRDMGLAWLAIASVVMLIFSISVRCLGFGAYDHDERPPLFLLVPT